MTRRYQYPRSTQLFLPPTIAATPTQFGWFQPLSLPVLPRRAFPQGQQIWDPFVPPPATPGQFGWYEPFNQPVYARQQNPQGQQLWIPWIPPPATPGQFGWYEPFSTPTLPAKRFTEGQGQWIPFIPPPATPSQFGWFSPWNEPQFSRHSNQDWFLWVPFIPTAQSAAPSFGWYEALAQPQKVIARSYSDGITLVYFVAGQGNRVIFVPWIQDDIS